ncbi:indole-3-glycerol-phosphate synthase [Methanohalobium sp.]|uniref:indole-3-glycerol-phosphate synthase n=1 Tax=Methanohalobium sp. TaxID=2837493 RepID=UPI0025D31EE9|nr:indole-3-glycerol-phosphate synthase [Methanohalobium sp.]
MHQTIEDIINSTKKRVECSNKLTPDSNIDKNVTRNIESVINKTKKEHKVPIIAEIKPASPGTFNLNVSPREAAIIAKDMQQAGATAISVLTETEYFHSSKKNLESARNESVLPVLRKDFIINENQMDEVQTDLILLIASILGDELDRFVSLALSKGLQPLVEVHNKNELEKALQTSAKLIGINNRNLDTFEINLQTTYNLAPLIKQYDIENNTHHIIISESGIYSTDNIKQLIKAGADALLIGSSIIKSNNIYNKTKQLVEALE